MKLEDIQKLTAEELHAAKRDYKFNLKGTSKERCACCAYVQSRGIPGSRSYYCAALDVYIANPAKSTCELFEDDGIPF
jgi:hypothetical protein